MKNWKEGLNIVKKENDKNNLKNIFLELNKLSNDLYEDLENNSREIQVRDYSIIKSGAVFGSFDDLKQIDKMLDQGLARADLNAVLTYLISNPASDRNLNFDEVSEYYENSVIELCKVIQEPMERHRDLGEVLGDACVVMVENGLTMDTEKNFNEALLYLPDHTQKLIRFVRNADVFHVREDLTEERIEQRKEYVVLNIIDQLESGEVDADEVTDRFIEKMCSSGQIQQEYVDVIARLNESEEYRELIEVDDVRVMRRKP